MQLEDIFDNPEYIFIVIELLTGGDLFSFLQKRNFRLSEDRARKIAH